MATKKKSQTCLNTFDNIKNGGQNLSMYGLKMSTTKLSENMTGPPNNTTGSQSRDNGFGYIKTTINDVTPVLS